MGLDPPGPPDRLAPAPRPQIGSVQNPFDPLRSDWTGAFVGITIHR